MKVKELFNKIKGEINKREKLFVIISILATLFFSLYNRILGIYNKSIWHESISIYYFVLVIIKAIIIIYINKSKQRKNDIKIFTITKVLLFILNLSMTGPVILMILNKRLVEMNLILSIAIALYVTINTTLVIINYVKTRKEKDILIRELNTIDLMDIVLSILTLQNTLIAVNSTGFDPGVYVLSIISSIAGILINLFLIIRLKKTV